MDITRSVKDGRRFYELTLSRRDFDDLCSGCPGSGFIVGRHNEVYFHLFESNRISDTWFRMDEGYGLNVGVKPPIPPADATSKEWDESAQKFYDSLEKAINASGIIPIEEDIPIFGELKKINMGYVEMKVEPELKE